MSGLTLYHFPSAICAQKVRLALAEKGLAFESREVFDDLRSPEYLAINPAGVVPTLEHRDRFLVESRIISEYLEDAFPDPPLLPVDPAARHASRLWSKMVDDSLHLNIFILSFAIAMRPVFLAMPEAIRAARLPGLTDPIKRGITLDLLEKGVASAYVPAARQRFEKLITDLEGHFAVSPWLGVDAYGLADADLTPYAARIEELGLAHLWATSAKVQDWIARCRARASYRTAVLDWRTREDQARFANNAATVAESSVLSR